jgi:pSer/pThr/pTyr-binding forkhead associated (FHA) protein
MVTLLPRLFISAPGESEQSIELSKTCYSVGRVSGNDIFLPDKEELISRQHCYFERDIGGWMLVDKHSTNGTIIQRGDDKRQVQQFPDGKVLLNSGDVILIHGWELKFQDFSQTVPASGRKTLSQQLPVPSSNAVETESFVYVLHRSTLFYVEQSGRQEINLLPQLEQMLEFMARKNLNNEGRPTLCTYEELIYHIWGDDEYAGTTNDINGLAWKIRKAFQKKGLSSEETLKLLETKKKKGYILHITCEE